MRRLILAQLKSTTSMVIVSHTEHPSLRQWFKIYCTCVYMRIRVTSPNGYTNFVSPHHKKKKTITYILQKCRLLQVTVILLMSLLTFSTSRPNDEYSHVKCNKENYCQVNYNKILTGIRHLSFDRNVGIN